MVNPVAEMHTKKIDAPSSGRVFTLNLTEQGGSSAFGEWLLVLNGWRCQMRDCDSSGKMTAHRFVCGLLMALGAALILAPDASACGAPQHQQPQPKLTQWVAATNNWFLNANWDRGVPTSIDTARVDNAGTAEIRSCGAAARVLEIGFSPVDYDTGFGEGVVTLYSRGTLSVGKAEYLGVSGAGDFFQFGGSHNVSSGSLTLGKEADGAGSYYLVDGSLSVKSATIVGQMGRGALYQESGTFEIECGALTFAQETGSYGSCVLDGGAMSVTGDENVGLNGSAAFDQYGGNNSAACGTLYVAKNVNSSAGYALHNGTLRVGAEVLGQAGISAFSQYGGLNIVSGSLTAGATATGNGSYYLSDGGLSVFGNETWGVQGIGVYYQDGGAHSVKSTLTIGGHQDSLGDFEVQAGEICATRILVGTLGGLGLFGIYGPDPLVTVKDAITLGPDAVVSATDGATIHMTGASGAFRNTSTDALALEGLDYLDVVFEGGASSSGSGGSCGHDDDCGWNRSGDDDDDSSCGASRSGHDDDRSRCGSHDSDHDCGASTVWATFEVASKDMGCGPVGFVQNFTLNALLVGGAKTARVKLLDASDNGNRTNGKEALYTHEVVVTRGSTLDLNGLKVYCDGTVDIRGTVRNGTVMTCTD